MPRWKRVFDIGVIILLLPALVLLFGLVALGLKIMSSGPVFARDRRYGFGARPFTCYHFRREWLLDAIGLVELPELINVLRGEMSLVGPRPCTPEELEAYMPWQWERFDTPPGLTGVWQVCGGGQTTLADMVGMDLHYVRNRSFWMDTKLLLKTTLSIFTLARDRGGIAPLAKPRQDGAEAAFTSRKISEAPSQRHGAHGFQARHWRLHSGRHRHADA
ncbi:MAG: sugar transferase [Candidatus Omnitrophica bacterium]|nr:sugar transferase [Candidatus Omnitrophota bacterium]